MSQLDPEGREAGAIPPDEFRRVQDSTEFAHLKKVFRGFAFPMTAAFMIWYAAYVLLSTFATGFMSAPVIGHVTWGLLLGLAQFATTFLITWLYIRHMNTKVDPLATQLREELERSAR
ncbi:DUF485 domain-containing protein [Tessaracoccus sp. OH4464_COT-324]|uniref:DUF485 domain-containing protein n=1 Tax=Tessaracoccus sp. OH4464_COT-324 TaxID=2491059 RepID=UPI000F6442D3|nr:DUF485 domain-containing protein [Tessaracoccus sp. OH4464_COT-324]RRD46660.1 DUF485 domain-containing protein [Tessaracoccus sp. OH4464_COT-324]